MMEEKERAEDVFVSSDVAILSRLPEADFARLPNSRNSGSNGHLPAVYYHG